MNRALWVAQVALAIVFVATGLTKLFMPMAAMEAQMPVPLPPAFIRFLGAAEFLGALGMILPGLLRIRPWLTPLAASGLVVIMIGATTYTVAYEGIAPALMPLVVGLVAAFVAYGRWILVPLSSSRQGQGLTKATGQA